MQGKEEEGEVNLNVAFKKGNIARSATDEVAAAAGQGVTPIQTSPHQIHAANSRIRPDPAGPDEEDADASERAPSLDLAKQVTGVLPPDTQVHHRLATHAAEGRRP